jgi:predicted transcriptional regulator
VTATTTMTIRITPEVKEKLGKLARGTRRTSSFLAAEAVSTYVDRELEIIEGINHALEDVKAGRVVPHEQVVAEAREIIAQARRTQGRASRK